MKQRTNGSITITDERMTRFWITLDQGVKFVINCIGRMVGGEVFVPKIPSMRVGDIAKTIAPGIPWKTVGIRPGEKLHEELITVEEAPRTKEFDGYYVIEPEHPFWNPNTQYPGRTVSAEFQYRSDTNTSWLKPEELQDLTQDIRLAT